MSVNLSAAQFRKPGLLKRIAGILGETALDPIYLDLELTENLLVDDTENAIRTMREMTALGLTVSIDDFGTGYASLSYLTRLPVRYLKIDRTFIRDVTNDTANAAIVDATIALAHRLNLSVIAEGVENEAQLAYLRRQGCDQGQGYLFSRPLPAADIGEWLRVRHAVAHLPMRAAS